MSAFQQNLIQDNARLVAIVGSCVALLVATAACSPQVRDTGNGYGSSYDSCLGSTSPSVCNSVSSGSGQSYNQYTGSSYGAPGTSGTYYNNTGYPYTSTYSSSSSPYSGSNYSYGVGSNYYHKDDQELGQSELTQAYQESYKAYVAALPAEVRADMDRQWEALSQASGIGK